MSEKSVRRYCRTRSVGPRPSESVEGKEAEAGDSKARIADAGRHSPLALAAGRSQDGVLQQRLKELQEELLERHAQCSDPAMMRELCPCPGECPLKGRCCACVAWHRDHGKKPLPHCLRDLDGVTWKLRG